MRIHILGVCGVFMGGLAALARAAGHEVSGSDARVYPPMSTLLRGQGIRVSDGYDPAHLDPPPDVVVIGNALGRGNAAVEYVLERGLAYTSGPQWLSDNVLRGRWVLAVAGTHGKTTTTALLAWILEYAGLAPGFVIGGVAENFAASARLGDKPFFVIEADEYDTAFFDKRAKFVHYRPRTVVLNNLEYDHADIYPDLAAIETQFHYLVRAIPANGLIIHNGDSAALHRALGMGCWTPCEMFSAGGSPDKPPAEAGWRIARRDADGGFAVELNGRELGETVLALPGRHNQLNAVAAIAAARHAGVPVQIALQAVREFKGVKRRMQLRGAAGGVRVYDDFAHHPTAIAASIAALRERIAADGRILAVLEPRSNSMRMGAHKDALPAALAAADRVYLYQPPRQSSGPPPAPSPGQTPAADWDIRPLAVGLGETAAYAYDDIEKMARQIARDARGGDHILVMSNGGFADVHTKILRGLS